MLSRPELLEEYVVQMSNLTVLGRDLASTNFAGVTLLPQGALTYADRRQVSSIVRCSNFTLGTCRGGGRIKDLTVR